jgi:hypothetical protein
LLERQQAFAGSDQRRATATELAADLERAAGGALVDSRRRVCPSPEVALSEALLVARAGVAELKAKLTHPRQDVRILVNGPWPPYTFAAAMREE